MNKIEQLIEKIIDDMGERPFARTWEGEARNMRKILKKHLQSLQEPTEEIYDGPVMGIEDYGTNEDGSKIMPY